MSNVRPESMQRINNEELANAFIAEQTKALKEQIGDNKVLLALSGGVDSSVTAALLIRAIGKQLTCVHVNHGLLRKGEPEQVIEVFRNQMDANLIYVDATDRFLDALAGVDDPEKKRKIIGKIFIDVFAEEAKKLDDIKFLAQGTIYPDILESVGVKAHHNVGGLPEDLNFELVEPVKFLYKDEVRVVGKALGPKGRVERVVGDRAAVHREKHTLAAIILPEGHVVAHPALHPPPLVIIASGALAIKLRAALEAVDKKLPQIAPDVVKILDQLAVGHVFPSFPGLPGAGTVLIFLLTGIPGISRRRRDAACRFRFDRAGCGLP